MGNKVTRLDNNNVDQHWPSTLASLIRDVFPLTKSILFRLVKINYLISYTCCTMEGSFIR